MEAAKKERVIAYIDGFNLYFGLSESGFHRHIWLDVKALVQKLLNSNQELIQVNYFTTVITNDVNKRLRQKQYIGALESQENIKVIRGKFQNEKNTCKRCGGEYYAESEKMTDVGIATQIIVDYYEDKFDMAFIISGDTDLLPPIKLINEAANSKRVFVAFPPSRVNDEVRKFSKGSMVIGRKNITDSQLPSPVTNKLGETFTKPPEWN